MTLDGTDHLAQEGLAFCMFCGGPLTGPFRRDHGYCAGCDLTWDRVYSRACPTCADGWVHLHHPDVVHHRDPHHRTPTRARGYGWCDCCGAHCQYAWLTQDDVFLFVLTTTDPEGDVIFDPPADLVEHVS